MNKLSPNTKKTLPWIYERTKRFFPLIALTTLFTVSTSILAIYLAKISKDVIDNGTKGLTNKLLVSSIMIFVFAALQILIDAINSMLNIRLNGKYVNSMRRYMFTSILQKKYSKIFGHHSGDILNRFTNDIDTVASGSLGIIPAVCSMLTKILVGGIALFLENKFLALCVLLIGFLFPLLGRLIRNKYKHLHKDVQNSEGQSRAFIQESFANVVVIKTFSSQTPIINKLNEFMEKNLKLKMKRNLYSVLVHIMLYSFFTFGYYFILVWGSSKLSLGGSVMTFGTLNYYLQLVSILRAPLQNISSIIPTYYSMIASAERLMDIENIENEPEAIETAELTKTIEEFNTIKVENLAFAYGEELILKNCSFEIGKNQITAITGESGSGKSTLFKLILGLYDPTGGRITFNGTTNIDASTRGMFSYVPQTNMLLSGTIRDNITLCDQSITEEQIIKATKTAVIYDFIKDLPDGFDTVLTERGGGLSEGQLQRISIARALLFDAPILLLDESTSALDEATETQLLSNIKNIAGKTVVFITHRHTSLAVCDRIIHVEDKQYKVIK
ncbi:MAG: ABC transporter ATP-binding protein/permease [Clostridia bacterium]|nr:ABC transporter ATP-binding protein/permease [Clostridia bacterium]